jgi:IPT/TIG domain-containing protein
MVPAFLRHRLPSRCLAFLLLAGACGALAAAQQPPKSHASPVPRQIILPPKLVAGAQVTLAVLDSQGRLMPNVAVELSGDQKVTTDVTGRALFKAPQEQGAFSARISGQTISASTIVIAPEDSSLHAAPGEQPAGGSVFSYPLFLAIHDRFTLEGAGFRGAADSNRVYLNGEPCLVVASSPVSLVVLPGPRVPVGEVQLRVAVAGIDAGSFPVSAVMLEFSGPAEAVVAGSTGKLVLHVWGTTAPLPVEIRNGSPGVIQLTEGNVQRLVSSGGDQNIAPVEVNFVTGGNYSVFARLLSRAVNAGRTQPPAR